MPLLCVQFLPVSHPQSCQDAPHATVACSDVSIRHAVTPRTTSQGSAVPVLQSHRWETRGFFCEFVCHRELTRPCVVCPAAVAQSTLPACFWSQCGPSRCTTATVLPWTIGQLGGRGRRARRQQEAGLGANATASTIRRNFPDLGLALGREVVAVGPDRTPAPALRPPLRCQHLNR